MQKMDRLFGKEITNILEAGYNAKHRNYQRITSKTRIMSIEQIKKENPKQRISVSHSNDSNQSEPLQSPQCVPIYFQSCLHFMLDQENLTMKISNYMEKQNEINENMRSILIDWLIDLHLKFKMFPETLFTVVTIIDRYLTHKNISKNRLQLVGVAALFIAAKYEETYQVPELRDLVHLSAKAFSKEQILEMEADIIKQLDFNLIIDSVYKFFSPLSLIAKLQPKNVHLAQYVLQLSLFDMSFLKYSSSLIAASCIYLINKIRKRSSAWSQAMNNATGYEQGDLKNCARQLCYLLENAENLPNTKSLKRKFSLPCYHEVTKIRLQRRQKSKN